MIHARSHIGSSELISPNASNVNFVVPPVGYMAAKVRGTLYPYPPPVAPPMLSVYFAISLQCDLIRFHDINLHTRVLIHA